MRRSRHDPWVLSGEVPPKTQKAKSKSRFLLIDALSRLVLFGRNMPLSSVDILLNCAHFGLNHRNDCIFVYLYVCHSGFRSNPTPITELFVEL